MPTATLYRQLRNIGLGETYRFDNCTVQFDAATFQFQKGTLTFLKPVDGLVTGVVFLGEGHFNLNPVTPIDAAELKRRTGATQLDEDFTEVIFRFSNQLRMKFFGGIGEPLEPSPEVKAAFGRWQTQMRTRREEPLGFSEHLLHGETMDNVNADVLAAIYNRQHPMFVNAYVRGRKHKDLRLFLRSKVGAIPQLAPEEVTLINYDPGGMEDGIWYAAAIARRRRNRSRQSSKSI
jgi:hypothetical protein